MNDWESLLSGGVTAMRLWLLDETFRWFGGSEKVVIADGYPDTPLNHVTAPFHII